MQPSEGLSTIQSKPVAFTDFGKMVVACKFEYSVLKPFLEDLKYKYFVLQASVADFTNPQITLISYPTKNNYEFDQEFPSQPVQGSYLDVSAHSKAYLGNNIINLKELREKLGGQEFSYLELHPVFSNAKDDWDHVIYEVHPVTSSGEITGVVYTTNPCPPKCPIAPPTTPPEE